MRRIIFSLTGMLALLLVAGGLTAPQTRAQPTPAQTLVGQRVNTCKADVRFDVAIVSADWTRVAVDRTARGQWAIAVADITNRGQRLEYAQGLVKLRDERGREFPWVLFNGENAYVEDQLAAQYGVTDSWEGIDRGRTVRTVLIFEVAPDARTLTLLPDDLACTAAPSGAAGPSGAAAPVRQTPAGTLIGQPVTACKGELRVQFQVVDTDWRKTVVGRTARGTAMWAVVIADVTNLGPFTDAVGGLAKVRDDRGREFSWVLFNGENIYVEDEIAAEFRLRPSWDVFTPGITERTVLLFEVAGDARTLTLLPDNLACGG